MNVEMTAPQVAAVTAAIASYFKNRTLGVGVTFTSRAVASVRETVGLDTVGDRDLTDMIANYATALGLVVNYDGTIGPARVIVPAPARRS